MAEPAPMSNTPQTTDDSVLDARIGFLLQAGVLSSAVVVLIGAVLYLAQKSDSTTNYSSFHGAPEGLNTFSGIFHGVLHAHPLAIIQFGLLMLIATPIARVVFSVIAFLAERDYLYVVISAIVLAVLLYGLTGH